MKIQLLFLSLLISLGACSPKANVKTEAIAGEFLYYDGAAVLNTGNDIYGMVIDNMLHELHQQAIPIQKDSFDMVQVYVKGVITDNPNTEGWQRVVQVIEIDSVAPSTPIENQTIQILTQ
ncbi:MAG: hypothetical protein ACPF80_01150 [Flavobacteriaceae bacterium]